MKIKLFVKYPHHVSTWVTPAVVFCFALAVRLIYNLTVARDYVALYDAGQYQRIALHLLSEHCFCDHSYIPTIEL